MAAQKHSRSIWTTSRSTERETRHNLPVSSLVTASKSIFVKTVSSVLVQQPRYGETDVLLQITSNVTRVVFVLASSRLQL